MNYCIATGMKAKSDPYIEVRLCPKGPSQSKANKVYVGKTPPVMKTLNPVWKNQRFSVTLPKAQFTRHSMFELTIMDYDEKNEDDLMGVVPIPIKLDNPGTTTKWHRVPPKSAGGEGASGDVECVLSIRVGGQDPEPAAEEGANKATTTEQPLVARPSKRRSFATTTAITGPTRIDVIEMELVVVRARGLTAMDSNIIGECRAANCNALHQ